MSVLVNEFTWSKSRDSLFQECRRAYFLQYYGAWGGWDRSAPAEAQALYVMKNLSSRPAWVGILVHEVAERAVRALVQGRPWPLEQALKEAEARLRGELELSRSGSYQRGARLLWGGRRVKVHGLQEHFYQEAVGDEAWEESIALALQCIQVLYGSPAFRRLQVLEDSAILTVEELEAFWVENVKVWVKLDLAVQARDGGVVIVDWKTGASHCEQDVALQLGIYGLYGSRKWSVAPEAIQGYDINLRDGATRRHAISADSLDQVRTYILDSAAQMRAPLKDVGNNVADRDSFPMTDNLYSCSRCRFRRACKREQPAGELLQGDDPMLGNTSVADVDA